MRYVLAWRSPGMAASAFWYYEYDPAYKTMTFQPGGDPRPLDEFLRGLHSFVNNGSLVYFKREEEN